MPVVLFCHLYDVEDVIKYVSKYSEKRGMK